MAKNDGAEPSIHWRLGNIAHSAPRFSAGALLGHTT